MKADTIRRVQHSWAQLLPTAPQAGLRFYADLFSRDPALKPLFKGDMTSQANLLMHMIGVAVGKLTDLETLLPALQAMGRRHAVYGVCPAHYATVGAALLATLAEGLGAAFTAETEAAWREVYGAMSGVMMAAEPLCAVD